MPVETRINVPFVPQEGITNSILQAIQLANESHVQSQKLAQSQQQIGLQQQAQPSEIAQRTAQTANVQAQTAAGLPAAQAALSQATAEKTQLENQLAKETNPIQKQLLQSQANMKDIAVRQAQAQLDFYGHVAGNPTPGAPGTGFDQLDQKTRGTLGKLSQTEKAMLDSAKTASEQEGVSGNPGALEHYNGAVKDISNQRNDIERAKMYAQLGMNRSTKAYLDTDNNQLTEMTPAQFIAAHQADPNKFVEYTGTVATADKAGSNIKDIRDGIGQMNGILTSKGFQLSDTGRTIMAAAHKDPTILNTALTAEALAKLSPPERDFFTAAQSLTERAMSLRGLQGQGAGSESQRQAVIATLPNLFDPDPAMSKQRLDQFKNVVDNVALGIPKVGKQPQSSAGQQGAAAGGGGKTFTYNPATGKLE